MDSTFVRQDFYIDPPSADADPKEWAEWLKRDNRKAAAAKAAHTKSLEYADTPEEFQSGSMRKVGGVWRQSVAVGFNGSAEEGTCTVEPVMEATQEKATILSAMEENRNKRGGSKSGKSARRHKNRKRRKKKGK